LIAGVLLSWVPLGPVQAQSAPSFALRSTIASQDQVSCGVSALTNISAGWPQASVQLLSGPITRASPAQSWRPGLSLDLSTDRDRPWQARASSFVGPIDQRCRTQSEVSRGWVELSRTIGRNRIALSAGLRSRGALVPSRDRQGLALSFSRAYNARSFGVDFRAFDSERTAISYFNRTLVQPDSIRNDSIGGWIPTTRTTVVRDSGMTRSQTGMLGLGAHWTERYGRFVFAASAGGFGEVRSRDGRAPTGDSLSAITPGSGLQWQLWVAAGIDARLSENISAALSVAAMPQDQARGIRASRAAALGLTVSASAFQRERAATRREDGPAFEVLRLPVESETVADDADGERANIRIRLRHGQASHVDVSGDAFGWQAIPLRKSRGGWWETDVRLPPGTYRMSVRVNRGRWTAPPGFPALRDEFGSEASLVSVP
jgi:hypothetical protein